MKTNNNSRVLTLGGDVFNEGVYCLKNGALTLCSNFVKKISGKCPPKILAEISMKPKKGFTPVWLFGNYDWGYNSKRPCRRQTMQGMFRGAVNAIRRATKIKADGSIEIPVPIYVRFTEVKE